MTHRANSRGPPCESCAETTSPAALFAVAGALVLAVSGDLPFGTLASPGAGMLPTLLVVLMMAFGLAC